jgi:hypothetical protein
MKRFTLAIISLFILMLATAQEYRGAVSAEFSLLPNLDAEAEVELRKVFYPGSYFNRTFQGKLSYDISSALKTALSYSYSLIDKDEEFSDEAEGESSERHKVSVDFEFETGRYDNDLKFSNRMRLQMAALDENKPKAYFRNKFSMDYRVSKKMNPYIAVEPYFNIRKGEIKVIRCYLGNELTLFNSNIDIYYIAEIRPVENYTTAQYIIGISVKLDYRKQ